MKNTNIKKICLAALFAALCFVATAFISFPLPTGYANLGDCFAFMAGFVLGMPWGIAAAGIGSMLADIVLGYAVYAPATFVLKAIIAVAGALCIGVLLRHKTSAKWWRLAMPAASFAGEALMVSGYFLYECYVLGVGEAALASIPVNIGQGAVGMLASIVIASVFLKVPALSRLMMTTGHNK